MGKIIEYRDCSIEICKVELFGTIMYTFGVKNPIGFTIEISTMLTESLAKDYAISAVNSYIDYELNGCDDIKLALFGDIDEVNEKLIKLANKNKVALCVIEKSNRLEKRKLLYDIVENY